MITFIRTMFFVIGIATLSTFSFVKSMNIETEKDSSPQYLQKMYDTKKLEQNLIVVRMKKIKKEMKRSFWKERYKRMLYRLVREYDTIEQEIEQLNKQYSAHLKTKTLEFKSDSNSWFDNSSSYSSFFE